MTDNRATAREEKTRRVLALRGFFKKNLDKLESPTRWSKASGVPFNSINEALTVKEPDFQISTLEKLAIGASILLARFVSIDELIGREFKELSNKEKIEEIIKILPESISEEAIRMAEQAADTSPKSSE
jgi:hypothetical protein